MSTIKNNKGQDTIPEPIRKKKDKVGRTGAPGQFDAARGKARYQMANRRFDGVAAR